MNDYKEIDRRAIEDALTDPNPNNPIARAVAAGICEFSQTLIELAERNGEWPAEILLYRPETAFDSVVIRLTLRSIASEMGHHIDVHWLPREQRAA